MGRSHSLFPLNLQDSVVSRMNVVSRRSALSSSSGVQPKLRLLVASAFLPTYHLSTSRCPVGDPQSDSLSGENGQVKNVLEIIYYLVHGYHAYKQSIGSGQISIQSICPCRPATGSLTAAPLDVPSVTAAPGDPTFIRTKLISAASTTQ